MSAVPKKVNEFPDGWESVAIEDIAEVNPRVNKSEISDDLSVSFVPMPAVEVESGVIDVSQERPFSEVKKGFTPFIEGDVLFAKITPCMENGKMAVVPKVKNGYGFGSTEFHVLRPKEGMESKYLYCFVSSRTFRGVAQHNMSGAVGQKRVPTNYLKQHLIPVAPPEQQKRIVAIIEELFSHIDAGIEALKNAKQLLKQYRQSVLKAAGTGELTEEWREANVSGHAREWLVKISDIRQCLINKKIIAKPKNTAAINKDELPYQLPETWKWIRLDDFVLTSVDCPHSTPKYREQGKKCVRTADIVPGKLVLNNVRYVKKEAFDERNKRLAPQSNDVLYSREGGILGVACMIPEGEEVCLGQRMMIFRAESKLASSYLMHNLNSPLIVNRVKSLIGGSASPHLNVAEIRNFMFPIPPENECKVLLSLLEERLASIERLDDELDIQLVKSGKIKQSILASAFSGRLEDGVTELSDITSEIKYTGT